MPRRFGIGPWATPVLAATEVSLVWSGALGLKLAVVVGIVIEGLLWLSAASRAMRGLSTYRRARDASLDRWKAAEDALAELLPRPIAHLILLEPRLWVCLVRWVLRRHEGRCSCAFSYHGQIAPLLAVAAALVVIEGAAVDAILAIIPDSMWVWVVLGVHVYGLLLLGGLYASFVTRPHVVHGDRVVLRDSIFHEIVVPVRAVAGVHVERHPNLGRSGYRFDATNATALLALGDATVLIELDPSATLLVDGKRTGYPVRRLAASADDPASLTRTLQSAVSRELTAEHCHIDGEDHRIALRQRTPTFAAPSDRRWRGSRRAGTR